MNAILLNEEYAAGFNIKGKYNNVPEVIERLSKRDIDVVIVGAKFLNSYDDFELEILKSTFARYGARIEKIEQ